MTDGRGILYGGRESGYRTRDEGVREGRNIERVPPKKTGVITCVLTIRTGGGRGKTEVKRGIVGSVRLYIK